jgi:aminoglycoside phosphotransferase family enzyme/predicted kinase
MHAETVTVVNASGGNGAEPSPVTFLNNPVCFPHPVSGIRIIETHISWVVLTGEYAYKIKKPVNLGFLDFSTVGLRQHYCNEELRLNRRFAPSIYLEVVTLRGTPARPVIGGDGPILDYAIKMREFPQDGLADHLLARGELPPERVVEIAINTARIHAAASIADGDTRHGGAQSVLDPALQNFDQLLQLPCACNDEPTLRTLRLWTVREFDRLRGSFARRKVEGHIRECHGDLHLGNIVLLDGRMTAFDCIEFNDDLRWIDVMNEVAFPVMDFADHGRPDLGNLFLNSYLEETGDYEGMAVLRFYLVYRAMVRAKIHLMRAQQPHAPTGERARLENIFRGYLDLAIGFAHSGRPAIVVMHGLSGSGKTTVAQQLSQSFGAIRIRSDVERKRIAGLGAAARSGSAVGAGLYREDATRITYRRMAGLARDIADAGFTVIIDAAFLQRWQRDEIRGICDGLHLPFAIVSMQAQEQTLRARVARRFAGKGDASEADMRVLEHQLTMQDPLSDEELTMVVTADNECPLPGAACAHVARALASRLGFPSDPSS